MVLGLQKPSLAGSPAHPLYPGEEFSRTAPCTPLQGILQAQRKVLRIFVMSLNKDADFNAKLPKQLKNA